MSLLRRRENDPKRVAKNASRALEAANGPTLAPKGYEPDTKGREAVQIEAGRRIISSIPSSMNPNEEPTVSHKKAYEESAKKYDRNDW
jgi:hypothetical protein